MPVLSELSGSISAIVASAAPSLAAICIEPNRHITGLLWRDNMLLTIDQALPAEDAYVIVLSDRSRTVGRLCSPNRSGSLSALWLDTRCAVVSRDIGLTSLGSLVIVVGAEADGSPNVRLTVVHRLIHTAAGLAPMLDLPGESLGYGSLVLDCRGHLVGLAAPCPQGMAMAIPVSAIAQICMPARAQAAPIDDPPLRIAPRRGWIGVALQPIVLPDQLVLQTGQASGRLVVKTTRKGPADRAGVRVGDVVLALDGTSTCGAHALRASLGPDKVGMAVEIKLLRDGALLRKTVTVA